MKELIAIFLENLYPEMNEDSASRALDVCNEEYQRRNGGVGATPQDLVNLYDSAREYDVYWPQPIGRDTVKAIEGRFEKDSREKMKG